MYAMRVIAQLIADFARERPGLVTAAVCTLCVLPVQDVLMPHLTGRVVRAVQDMQKNAGRGARIVLRPFLALGVAALTVQASFAMVELVNAKLFPALATFVRRRALKCLLQIHDGTETTVYEPSTGAVSASLTKLTTNSMMVSAHVSACQRMS